MNFFFGQLEIAQLKESESATSQYYSRSEHAQWTHLCRVAAKALVTFLRIAPSLELPSRSCSLERFSSYCVRKKNLQQMRRSWPRKSHLCNFRKPLTFLDRSLGNALPLATRTAVDPTVAAAEDARATLAVAPTIWLAIALKPLVKAVAEDRTARSVAGLLPRLATSKLVKSGTSD
jgi:hypothetical protein